MFPQDHHCHAQSTCRAYSTISISILECCQVPYMFLLCMHVCKYVSIHLFIHSFIHPPIRSLYSYVLSTLLKSFTNAVLGFGDMVTEKVDKSLASVELRL